MTNVEPEDLKEALDVLSDAAESENMADLFALDGAAEEEFEKLSVDDAADPENTSLEDAQIAVLNSTAEAGPEPEETPEEEEQELAALDRADADEPGTEAVDGDMEDAPVGVASEDVPENVSVAEKRQNIYGEAAQNDISDGAPSADAGETASAETLSEAAGEDETPAPKTALLVSVGFRNAGKKLYYRTGGYDLHIGDKVIVETVRGMEMGSVVMPPMEMDLRRIHIDPAPVVRPANAVDLDQEAENRAREREAYHVCKQKIGEHGLDMKLVQAEYTFDRNKLIFYFTADGRVDFRQLLKDLASTFHTRIELRQIGVRDETRVLGGIGVCGREVCCKTYLRSFAPVSVKMAKEQNLSLNPTKISGLCGRLMCCLKNEEETYEYLNRAMPRLGSRVQTKEGETGVVRNIDILKQKASVLFEENDEREMRVYNVSDLIFRSYRGKREEGLPVPPPAAEAEAAGDSAETEIDMSVESELPASGSDGGRGGDRRTNDRRGGRRNDRRNDRGDRPGRSGGNRGRGGNYKDDRDGGRDAGASDGRSSADSREGGNRSRRNNDGRRSGYRRNSGEGAENGGRGASGEGRSSGDSRRNSGRGRRNNSENRMNGGYRRDAAEDGNAQDEGRANGGYSRGYRRDSGDGEGGRANGGYSRGYRDDLSHRDSLPTGSKAAE